MDLPRLSVVVPNYNHGKFLPACLDSLLGQSVKPFEIIVIDDASTDNSLEILAGYAGTHPIIQVHRNEKNLKVVPTMNRGIGLAKGDYLFFMAADDEVLPGFFEKSLSLLAAHPEAALSCTVSEWTYLDSGLKWHMGAGMADHACYLTPEEVIGVGRSGKLLIPTCATIMKREPLVAAGSFIPELKWHCDWFATIVPAFRHGMCYVPEPLSVFQISEQGYYATGRKQGEHREVLQKLAQLLASPGYADIRSKVRDSGALCMFGLPMLSVLRSRPEYRFFLNSTLVKWTLRRQAELVGKKVLPAWLKRWVLNRFYRQGAKPA